MKIKYYEELDGIRGLAAVMVMIFHFFQCQIPTTPITSLVTKISMFGQTGVTLFFVLSGFLITRILISTKSSKNYFSSFYLRRSLRIFPLYYFFLILIYYIIPIFVSSPIIEFKYNWYYWFYLQNFAITFKWPYDGPIHFWSLAVEEHFYLFWPLIVYISSTKNLLRISIWICIIAIAIRYILLIQNYDVFYFTFTNMDSLATGAILGIIEVKRRSLTLKSFYKYSLLAVTLITIFIWGYWGGQRNNIIQILKPTLLNALYFSLIGFVITLNEKNTLKISLSSPLSKYIGRISYGLYVYHPLCYSFIIPTMEDKNLFFCLIICIAVSIIIATLSYYLFEQKFIELKRFFIAKPKV